MTGLGRRRRARHRRASGTPLAAIGTGVITAVPLLLFASRRRVGCPCRPLGLTQYVAPVLQFVVGVVAAARADVGGALGRLRASSGSPRSCSPSTWCVRGGGHVVRSRWPRPPRSDHPSQSHESLTKRHFDAGNTRQKHSTPSFGPIAVGSDRHRSGCTDRCPERVPRMIRSSTALRALALAGAASVLLAACSTASPSDDASSGSSSAKADPGRQAARRRARPAPTPSRSARCCR